MKVILLPQAKEDLAGISEPLLSRILKRLSVLASYPSLGEALGSPVAAYRATTVAPFRIIYRQTGPATLHIAFIRHCRRGRILP